MEFADETITGDLMEYFEATEELSKQDMRDLESAVSNVLVHFHDEIVGYWKENDSERDEEEFEEQYGLMCNMHPEIDEWLKQMIIDYKTTLNETGEFEQLVNNTLPDEYYREYIDFTFIRQYTFIY